MKPTIRLPRQIATALQILRGVVDTDPQGEVCEASSECTRSAHGTRSCASPASPPSTPSRRWAMRSGLLLALLPSLAHATPPPPWSAPVETTTPLQDWLGALGLGLALALLCGGATWLCERWRRWRVRRREAIHLWPLALLALAPGGCTVPEGDWAGLVIFGLLCAATAAAQRP